MGKIGQPKPIVYGDENDEMIREYMMKQREQHLACVDQLERSMKIEPRTSELRKWYKDQQRDLVKCGG